jgi:NAD(P)-dependent dehydrogenase (short-subunit alcohol dehydrogenase family)
LSKQDKVVLITGATTALGRQLVSAFSSSGAQLALSLRDPLQLASYQAELHSRGIDAFVLPCDIRLEEEVVRMVHRVMQRFGRVDVLINAAAAAGISAPLIDYPSDAWGDVIATHITGTYLVCREVLPWMTRQRAGSIINLTSNISEELPQQTGPFVVSACGIDGLTRMLASELEGTGVRANAVVMGLPNAAPDESILPHAVDTCLWLASDASALTTGQRLSRNTSVNAN